MTPYARATGAELAVAAGLTDAEKWLSAATPYAGENRWAAATLARARGRLHDSNEELESAAALYSQIGAAFERRSTLDLMDQSGPPSPTR